MRPYKSPFVLPGAGAIAFAVGTSIAAAQNKKSLTKPSSRRPVQRFPVAE